MSDSEPERRWRVRIATSLETSVLDLPPGGVTEVSILHSEGTWAAVMTAKHEHVPYLLDRALALPGFCRFDVFPHILTDGER